MELRPVTLTAARRFVAETHRHAGPPQGWLFGVGLYLGDELIGIGIAGRPLAAGLQDGRTVEITRISVVDSHPNACSRLYGALCRAAKALGYQRAITYTRSDEPGTSPTAAGFNAVAKTKPRNWAEQSGRPRYDTNLFGEKIVQESPRVRWEREL